MTATPKPIKPTCPRCGYDRSGEVASWTDRCPVDGQCPECGTHFAWSDLFDPARQSLPWLVEHTRSIRGRAWRTTPTLLYLALPWVFWSRVDIHARTDPRAVAGWLLMLFIALHLLCWLPLTLMLAAGDSGYALSYAELSSMIGSMPAIEFFFWLANGLIWPFASIPDIGRWEWGDYFHAGDWLLSIMRIPLGISLTWFAVLIALPVTRRIAMLRSAHLKRALLFHFGGLIVVFSVLRVLYIIASHGTNAFWTPVIGYVCFFGFCIWTLAWWISAAAVGWRIRSWPLLVLTTLASLLGGVVLYVIEMSVSYFQRFYF